MLSILPICTKVLQSGQNGPLLQDLPRQHFLDHPACTLALCLQTRQDVLPSRPSIFSFWLLTRHEKWDYELGCFALKIRFECAFLQRNRHVIRGLLLLHMTIQSAKENELLWPYFLKMTVNKWMWNSVITVNVMKTPPIYKIQYRYIGQGKTWPVDILMGWDFICCRRCTLTTGTVLTINMSE